MPVEHGSFREFPIDPRAGLLRRQIQVAENVALAFGYHPVHHVVADRGPARRRTRHLAQERIARADVERAAVLLTKQSQISVSFQRRLGSKPPDVIEHASCSS